MESYWKEFLRIKEILNAHPRGMTVSELSRRLQITRNSVAKYLDVLLSTGQIEMRKIGPAKMYFISERIPHSSLLYLYSDAMLVLDDEGRTVFANDSFLKLAAASLEEIHGKEILKLDSFPADDPQIVAALKSPLTKPLTMPNLVSVSGENGTAYLRVKLFPTVLEGGVPGTSIVFEDVTDQMRVHLELGVERARLKAIIDSAPEAIVVTDAEGSIRMLNPAAESLCAASAFCQPCGRMCDPHDLPLIRSARHGETVRGVHLATISPEGEQRELLANTAPIAGDNGRVFGAVGIFQEITEQKRIEAALRESQERYRSLVENSPAMIAVHDGERYLFINPAGLQLLGAQEPGDVVGKPVTDFLHPDSHDLVQVRFEQLRTRAAAIPPVEVRLLRLDGSAVTVESSGHTLVYKGRSLMQVVARDITKRKQMEEAARASDARMRALLNAPPDSALLIDREGTILALNEVAATRLGGSADDLVGRQLNTLLPQDIAAARRGLSENVFASGKPLRFSDERDGMVFETTFFPVRDAQGDVRQIAVFARDVTVQRQLETTRREACDRIQQAVDSLTIQSDNVRQPLQVILALADLMNDEETAGRIRQEIRRINAYITEVDRGREEFCEIREALRRLGVAQNADCTEE
ncbi:PAS domain S-box protein [Methanoculleus sp. FWC-SCC1]|uniref:PAS domain S-box protein n=1 Tax=Methanoculleus frigidifontis TaxID=2584085 RepID=A0ABT8M979_9EURY|nr:PAS domain S-box protein [Methanoculleus sp. FWC-SCC1]MDN7024492.1 PAS domain S-box protein [Methanoculleus sp. FWC-SCC1]